MDESDDTSLSPEAARAHVATLDQIYSPNCSEALALTIQNAIALLSSDLYSTSTHFLQELLQNADDNDYDSSGGLVPTLKFTYRDGTLRVDCNEKGFERRHVEAICGIGVSTKRDRKDAHKYTGEKGIGFKSVFRAADIIWLSSRQYRMRFDTKRTFGTLRPVWDDFPESILPRHTSFLLQLSDHFNKHQLLHELLNFDPLALIFLRRLERIELEVTQDGVPWRQTLHRMGTCASGDTVIVDIGSRTLRYLMWRHDFGGLPAERRRPGVTTSHLVLGFPYPENVTDFPLALGGLPVYAGLPINSHGLKFLIQGDFILTTNRERIDESLAWNSSLRDALPAAMVKAIEHLNTGQMKYVWPIFIPGAETTSAFFQPGRESIIAALREMNVLESSDGTMKKPSELAYLDPSRFADDMGQPFTSCPDTHGRYLSPEYSPKAIEMILTLGVQPLSDQEFIEDLDILIMNYLNEFQGRSAEWHDQLAKVLIPMTNNSRLRPILSKLFIIPLSNDEWASAQSEPVPGMMSQETSAVSIPVIPRIRIVQQVAASQANRRFLFQKLGVRHFEKANICNHVTEEHHLGRFDPYQLTTEELAAHVVYLYNSSYAPSRAKDLWFATSVGDRCKGSRLYIHSDRLCHSPTAKILHHLEKRFKFIHEVYYSVFKKSRTQALVHPGSMPESICNPDTITISGQKHVYRKKRGPHSLGEISCTDPLVTNAENDWVSYLVKHFQLSTVPRLVLDAGNSFQLSEEFRFLFKECRTHDVIQILSDNYQTYSQWIEPDSPVCNTPKLAASRKVLIKEIGDLPVETREGIRAPLRKTFFPGLDPDIEDYIEIPMLDVPRADDSTLKRRLEIFGVTVDNNVEYYIEALKSIQPQHSPDIGVISMIYQRIQSRYDNNEDTIESAFKNDSLIFATSPAVRTIKSQSSWVDIDTCIARKFDVVSCYPQSEQLFKCLLATGGLRIDTLITKAISIDTSSSPPDIAKTFISISGCLALSAKNSIRVTKSFRGRAIFPITSSKRQANFSLLPAKGGDWFIADRDHLRESFLGVVPLLAFTIVELQAMDDLLKTLNLGFRRLSGLVKKQQAPRGPLTYKVLETSFFCARVPFIKALIPPSNTRRDKIVRKMEGAIISSAAEICETYTISGKNGPVSGQPGKAKVCYDATGNALQIYVSEDSMSSEHPMFHVIDVITDLCDIRDPAHYRLLFFLFSDPLGDVIDQFKKHGISISLPQGFFKNVVHENSSRRRGDLMAMLPTMDSRDDHGHDNGDCGDSVYNSSSEETESDVPLHGIHFMRPRNSNKHRRRKRATSLDLDRRVPIRNIVQTGVEISIETSGPRGPFYVGKRLDPDRNLEYLGQRLLSKLLQKYLGDTYDPVKHWTSLLRTRAGIDIYEHEDFTCTSPFTLADETASKKMCEFLAQLGVAKIQRQYDQYPTYHFEVAATAGGSSQSFTWSTAELDRARRFRLPSGRNPRFTDVVILARVSCVIDEPLFQLLVDPWQMFASGRLGVEGNWNFNASIQEPPAANLPNPLLGLDSQTSTKITTDSRLSHTPVLLPHYMQEYRSTRGPMDRPPAPWIETSHTPADVAPETACHYGSVSNDSFSQIYDSYGTAYKFQPFGPTFLGNLPHHMPGPISRLPPNVAWYPFHQPPPLPPPSHNDVFKDQDMKTHEGFFGAAGNRVPEIFASPQSQDYIADIGQSSNLLNDPDPVVRLESHDLLEYTYRPLDQGCIRLLSLFPGERDAPLKGVIWTVPFTGVGHYIALSYVWGEEKLKACALSTPDGMIRLTLLLHNTLTRIRHTRDILVLWVDAVCIHQADKDEKARQLSIMPKIFQQATCTLAFLGADEESDLAMQTLMQIGVREDLKAESSQWPKDLPRCPSSWGEQGMPSIEDPVWEEVIKLFRRPWFRRAWIVQEIIIASHVKVVCGKYNIRWDDLFHVMERVRKALLTTEFDQSTWEAFFALNRLRKWEEEGVRWPILRLLESFRHVDSTLRRDRFYALLGIASDGNLQDFEPDYRCPFENVVRRFASALVVRLIQDGGAMELLYRAGLGSDPGRFPSWIPDWTSRDRSFLHDSLSRGVTYGASEARRERIECIFGPDGLVDELRVEGYFIDEIEEISSVSNEAKNRVQFFHAIEKMLGTQKLRSVYTKDMLHKLMWKVPIADSMHPDVASSGDLDLEESYKAFRRHFKRAKYNNKRERTLTSHEKEKSYFSALDKFPGWRFIITKKRSLCGIAPNKVQAGDRLYVFNGGDVPFVLRKSQDKRDAFQLVGGCYVWGIMYGQALEYEDVTKAMVAIH